MDDRFPDATAPASRRSEKSSHPSSVPPQDRATPVADVGTDYASYIVATGATKGQARNTMRIEVGELGRLVDQSRRTGSMKRPHDLPSAADPVVGTSDAAPAPTSRRRALPAIVGLAVAVVGAALWLSLSRARVAASTGPGPADTATVAPAASAPGELAQGDSAATPRASATPPVELQAAERQARAALERLRSGLGECIRHGIHGLPGSSPAVPATLAALKGGTYVAGFADWKTAVWSCAHFQIREPMSFQLQWQLLRPGVEGLAIAWIDADRDGVADRALGFRITFGPRGELQLGEIGPAEASRPVLAVH